MRKLSANMIIKRIRGRTVALLAIGVLFSLISGLGQPADPASEAGSVVVLPLKSSINPITKDYLVDSIQDAAQAGAGLVLIELDTPGGLVSSTREIVSAILNSSVPVAVWVGPSGAWAASAGTFITMSADVAAMAPGTTIGAAHPVSISGGAPSSPSPSPQDPSQQDGSEGQNSEPSSTDGESAAEQKTINFTAEWARQIAESRGRNADWAEQAVRESVTAGARDAVEDNIIDLVADSREDLLSQLDGYRLPDGRTLQTANAPVDVQEMSWQEEMLNYLADPNLVYLLLTIGTLALVYEFLSPTIGIGFIAGGISLLLAFMGLQILPVNVVGLALILFGILLMVLDVFTASSGILTTGGVVALLVGSFSLFDIASPNVGLSPWTILPTVVVMTVTFAFFVGKGLWIQRRAPVTGREGLIGAHGVAKGTLDPEGWAFVKGEHWTARSSDGQPIREGEAIVVEQILEGAKLIVRRLSTDK